MMKKNLLLTLLLIFYTAITFAQKDKSYRTITVAADRNLTFDKLVDFIQDEEFFILSLDKQSGFIQAKIYLEDKRLLSTKEGDRRIMNFMIRPAGDKTNVTLNIYTERHYANANGGPYYEDKGVLDTVAVYEGILSKFKASLPYSESPHQAL